MEKSAVCEVEQKLCCCLTRLRHEVRLQLPPTQNGKRQRFGDNNCDCLLSFFPRQTTHRKATTHSKIAWSKDLVQDLNRKFPRMHAKWV